MERKTGRARSIACVLLPHFYWQAAAVRRPQLKAAEHRALITTPGASGDRTRTVLDTSPHISDVLPGMPLDQAMSRCPDAVIVEADLPRTREIFAGLADALQEIVPNIEESEAGRVFLEINGLEKLYGDDANIVRLISCAASSALTGLDMRIGIGPSKWLAQVAATRSRQGRAYKISGNPRRFLHRLPLTALPISLDLVERMQSFGLETLGDIANLPRGACHAQFGADGARAWDLANGIDEDPLVPRRSEETVSESLEFPDATVNLFTIVTGMESLLSRAYSRPALRNRYARRCLVESRVFQTAPWAMRVAFKEPAGSKSDALFAVKTKLDTVQVPGPLVDMKLTLEGLTGEAARQESMWLEVQRSNDLSQALAQLQERIGEPPPIYRVETIKPTSKVPEWRKALVQLSL